MLKTFLKIGTHPDYVMKMGKLEILHRVTIQISNKSQSTSESMTLTNRSLWVVARDGAGILKLRFTDTNLFKLQWSDQRSSFEIKFEDFLIQTKLSLPEQTSRDDSIVLHAAFSGLFKSFFKVYKPRF